MKEDTATLLGDLRSRLDRLVAAARKEGREDALAQLRSIMGGGAPRRGPGRPPKAAAAPKAAPKRRKARKNPWESMTPEQKAERVRKMLAGRGLKPKNG